MGQAANIVVNDGTATPVAITFSPERWPDGRIAFVDRRKSSRALQPSIVLTQSPPNGARSTAKLGFEVAYPLEGVVNGVPAPVGIARFKDGKYIIPDIMSATDRAHLVAFATNFPGVALIKAAFKDLDYVV